MGDNHQQTGVLLNGANGQVTLNNVRIANNTASGIEFAGAAQLGCEKDCAIFGSENGIKISGASATFSNLHLHDNTNAIEATATRSAVNMGQMLISGNDTAIHLAATADTIRIDANGSTLKNNNFGISTDNVTTANIALKNVTLTDNKIGIATATECK